MILSFYFLYQFIQQIDLLIINLKVLLKIDSLLNPFYVNQIVQNVNYFFNDLYPYLNSLKFIWFSKSFQKQTHLIHFQIIKIAISIQKQIHPNHFKVIQIAIQIQKQIHHNHLLLQMYLPLSQEFYLSFLVTCL